MISSGQFWDPNEWDAWVDRLLKKRYGHVAYQRVPARVGGDFGIEGFSTDGCVYQCYSPLEPLSTEARLALHKRKMTSDVAKFIRNHSELVVLFNGLRIRRWILVVPLYDDKAILLHASKKTAEVIAAALPYVAEDFRVHLADESYFEEEKRALSLLGSLPVVPASPEPPLEAASEWGEANPELIDVLDEKIRKIATLPVERRIPFRDQLIQRYIAGQNTLQGYHEMWPELAETIVETKRDRAHSLAIECALSDLPGNRLVTQTWQNYSAQLRERIQGLPESSAHALSWEAVVEWLFNCPLEITEQVSHG